VYHVEKLSIKEKDAMIDDLNEERTRVSKWAKAQVKRMMLASAQKLEVKWDGHVVQLFQQIGKSWAEDGTDRNARKLYFVCFGQFEKAPTWSLTLELEYMTKNSLEYSMLDCEQDKERGCYERIITHAKGTVVRAINDATKKTHDLRIAISRDGVLNSNKFDKRSSGDFYIRGNSSVSNVHALGHCYCCL